MNTPECCARPKRLIGTGLGAKGGRIMLTRRLTPFTVMSLVMLAVIGTAVVMAQTAGELPPKNVDPDQIREDSVRGLFDSGGRMIDPEQQLADIAKEHEGGFGGYYFHETDKSIVYVYMKDIAKVEAAEAAFRAAYGGDRQITQVIPVQGDYSFDQLVEWFNLLDKALIESDIFPARASIREIENRIRIGLLDGDQIDDVRKIVERVGIPAGAVVVNEDYLRLLGDRDSVRSKWRPLVGGIQHETGMTSQHALRAGPHHTMESRSSHGGGSNPTRRYDAVSIAYVGVDTVRFRSSEPDQAASAA